MPNTVVFFCTMTTLLKCRWVSSKRCISVLRAGRIRRNFIRNLSVASLKSLHTPVLVSQVVDFLQPDKCDILVDMTFGGGGHTRKLLEKSKTVKIFCLDRDPLAHCYAQSLHDEYPDQIVPLKGKFSDLPALLEQHGLGQNSIDGILFDFGCSSMQFDDPQRGFAVSLDGPLDMRMDGVESDGVTAADVLAYASAENLHRIFKIYGEEKYAKKIANAIVQTRFCFKPVTRTSELRDLICGVLNEQFRSEGGRRFHSSAKVFHALRAFVNNEMNEINHAMLLAQRYLKIGGTMVAISLHPCEDTIVKWHITGVDGYNSGALPLKFFNSGTTFESDSILRIQQKCWKALNKHVITPGLVELDSNPRCRLAKLRGATKIQ